jgi:ribosomal protein S27E
MLYYLENTELIECKTCGHAHYKPKTGRGRILIVYRKLRYFSIPPRL